VSGENFLSRWSRRKTRAKQGEPEAASISAPQASAEAMPTPTQPPAPAPLPPIESLTPESDFSPFMRPDVDAGTRRLAMKKLFEDPRHNVMDRLDTYIDDYSMVDPLPEGWLEKMNQVARLGIFKPAPGEAEDGVPAPQGEASTAAVEAPDPSATPVLPAPEGASAQPLPSVTSGEGIDASPVRKSPPAEG